MKAGLFGFTGGALIALIAILVGKWLFGPAPQKQASPCALESTVPVDARIQACTTLIDARGQTPAVLETAHFVRGEAYAAKGDTLLALRDLDQAIRYNPKNARALLSRGLIHMNARE